MPVIVDATAHRRAWRDLARASIARFAEVQLDCPLGVAEARERTRAAGGGPDLDLRRRDDARRDRTRRQRALRARAVAGADHRHERRGRGLGGGADRGARADAGTSTRIVRTRPGGAVIWLTGPPGSGKTTLASRLAERLTADGAAVTVLEWTALRALALGAPGTAERGEEIAHRALAYTAKLLADAGLVVVVDATAPRRVWRALAREIVGAFAEVQLVCRSEVCLDRERAVRWRPHGGVADRGARPRGRVRVLAQARSAARHRDAERVDGRRGSRRLRPPPAHPRRPPDEEARTMRVRETS